MSASIVNYVVKPDAAFDIHPGRKDRKDGRQDSGYDVKAYAIEYSDRTLHGKWDKVLKFITFGLYKPVPCYIKVNIGVALQAEENTIWFCARMNSRAAKRPFILGNTPGTIDPGYNGDVYLIFDMFSWCTWEDINEYFRVGEVVGQLIPMRQVDVTLREAPFLQETSRQAGGFGSTANK